MLTDFRTEILAPPAAPSRQPWSATNERAQEATAAMGHAERAIKRRLVLAGLEVLPVATADRMTDKMAACFASPPDFTGIPPVAAHAVQHGKRWVPFLCLRAHAGRRVWVPGMPAPSPLEPALAAQAGHALEAARNALRGAWWPFVAPPREPYSPHVGRHRSWMTLDEVTGRRRLRRESHVGNDEDEIALGFAQHVRREARAVPLNQAVTGMQDWTPATIVGTAGDERPVFQGIAKGAFGIVCVARATDLGRWVLVHLPSGTGIAAYRQRAALKWVAEAVEKSSAATRRDPPVDATFDAAAGLGLVGLVVSTPDGKWRTVTSNRRVAA